MQIFQEIAQAIKDENLLEILRIISCPDYDINRFWDEYSPLSCAVEGQKPGLVRVFLLMGANPNVFNKSSYNTSMARALKLSNTEIAELLINDPRFRDPRKIGRSELSTTLHVAAARNNGPIVDLALEFGADPTARNKDGATPSSKASSAGHGDLCRYLRQREMSLQSLTWSRCHENDKTLMAKRNISPTKYPLMGHFISIEEMMDIVDRNDVDTLRNRINDGGIYVDNICVDFGSSGAWYACKKGSLEIVKMLFTLGASMTHPYHDQEYGTYFNSIEVARRYGHTQIVAYLEALKDSQIETFLHFMQEKAMSEEVGADLGQHQF